MGHKAVILSSGGLDSTTVLAIAKAEGFVPYTISFDYGQRHRHELEAAKRVSDHFHVAQHLVVPVDLRGIGGSALTADIDVPRDRPMKEMSQGIPPTYVPARNTVFLSLAMGWAEVIGSCDIFIGVNAIDYSGYPDCRPAFISAFEKLACVATKAGVEGHALRIHAPLMEMTKARIIRRGVELGVDYGLTFSCYNPSKDGISCGRCDACRLRLRGFREARVKDPIPYQIPIDWDAIINGEQ
ncbi:7-cyano-7-deazaguanine synthase QueC [bacterium]|nr:7-cyano-7-deazaguanine synthase QueC [bacterium]